MAASEWVAYLKLVDGSVRGGWAWKLTWQIPNPDRAPTVLQTYKGTTLTRRGAIRAAKRAYRNARRAMRSHDNFTLAREES